MGHAGHVERKQSMPASGSGRVPPRAPAAVLVSFETVTPMDPFLWFAMVRSKCAVTALVRICSSLLCYRLHDL